MPVYEYACDECGEEFDITATIRQKEKGLKPKCPKCGSSEVSQVFGRFTVMGSSKSSDDDMDDFSDDDYGAGEYGGDELGGEDLGNDDSLDLD